jgi:hypothetical protein
MPNFPIPNSARLQAPEFSGSTVITVASAAAAGTKGAWVQLIASTSFDCDYLMVFVGWGSSTRVSLIDIGIGGAGSEVAIASDLPYEQSGSVAPSVYCFIVPTPIKSGTRISARANISGSVTKQVGMWVIPVAGGYVHPNDMGKLTTYGVASTPTMTSLDPGATINTKGAYSQLVASTSTDIRALQLVCAKSGTGAASDWRVDVAIGAGGSEQIIIPDYYCTTNATAGQIPVPPVSPVIPVSIPVGTRIAARCSNSINTAGSRLLDVAIVGME